MGLDGFGSVLGEFGWLWNVQTRPKQLQTAQSHRNWTQLDPKPPEPTQTQPNLARTRRKTWSGRVWMCLDRVWVTLDQFGSAWVRIAWVWTGLHPSWVSLVPLDHLGTQTRYKGDDPGIVTTMQALGAPQGGGVPLDLKMQ